MILLCLCINVLLEYFAVDWPSVYCVAKCAFGGIVTSIILLYLYEEKTTDVLFIFGHRLNRVVRSFIMAVGKFSSSKQAVAILCVCVCVCVYTSSTGSQHIYIPTKH